MNKEHFEKAAILRSKIIGLERAIEDYKRDNEKGLFKKEGIYINPVYISEGRINEIAQSYIAELEQSLIEHNLAFESI